MAMLITAISQNQRIAFLKRLTNHVINVLEYYHFEIKYNNNIIFLVRNNKI